MKDDQRLQPESPLPDQQHTSLRHAELSRVAAALLDKVRSQHEERLMADDLDEIRLCLETQIAAAERLQAYPLTNADEPAFAFTPLIGEE